MIKSYREKKTVEVLIWNGEDKNEFIDFVDGEQNVYWKLFTNKPPIPEIVNKSYTGKEITTPFYIVKKDDCYFGYDKNEFESLYEEI